MKLVTALLLFTALIGLDVVMTLLVTRAQTEQAVSFSDSNVIPFIKET